MNRNQIITNEFSNNDSEKLYYSGWKGKPLIRKKYEEGEQCGACRFFAPFNADYGLCCFKESEHFLETVFEHFTCKDIIMGSWSSHSFSKMRL